MKKTLIIILLVISCKEKETSIIQKENTIIGLYNVIEPKGEAGNIYLFGKDELYHFIDDIKDDNKSDYHRYHIFKYFIKGQDIYTCSKFAYDCKNQSDFSLHYTIKSIDTSSNKQIVILKGGYYPIIKLSKDLEE